MCIYLQYNYSLIVATYNIKRINTPKFLTYIRHFSIFNYGFDLMMINQWEDITDLKCEYELDMLCNKSGPMVLKLYKIDTVSTRCKSLCIQPLRLDKYIYFMFAFFLNQSNKVYCISMLVLLAFSFRVIAFLVLWVKGMRRQFKVGRYLTKSFKSMDITFVL